MKYNQALNCMQTKEKFLEYINLQITSIQKNFTDVNSNRSKVSRKACAAGRMHEKKIWQQIDLFEIVKLFLVTLDVSDEVLEKVAGISCTYLTPVFRATHLSQHIVWLTFDQKAELRALLGARIVKDVNKTFKAFEMESSNKINNNILPNKRIRGYNSSYLDGRI